jgi:hypothetical protein
VLAICAVSVGFIGFDLASSPGDAAVPIAWATWLEPARDLSRHSAGLASVLPFRLVEARCGSDPRTAVFVFESAIGSIRTYALIDGGAVGGWTIVGLDEAGFEQSTAPTFNRPCS